MIKLDYSLNSPEERNQLVQKILEENPNPTDSYLESLADYLVLCMEKKEKKERRLITENRMATVNKRETSFEGLISQLENGEDGIYNLMNENKHAILQPKVTITKKDVEEIPLMRQLREAIEFWENQLKDAEGRKAFIIKKTIIDLRKDQYIMKNAYRKPIVMSKITKSQHFLPMEETVFFKEDNFVDAKGVSLMNPTAVSAILVNYSKLKENAWGEFNKDVWYLLEDFDNIIGVALAPYPLYEKLVECKIDGLQNVEIQKVIEEEFGIRHSVEYLSSLWRNKIPKLIASAAEDQYLAWHYLNNEKGKYKRCSRCGQVKLAHNKYFSKNKTSRDGYYSICKECRNAKK